MSDLISRKAILQHIEKIRNGLQMMDDTHRADIIMNGMYLCEKAVRNQPSAQPETARRIVGKSRDGMTLWYQCDMCNEPVDAQDSFCRGCGSRLTDG